MSVRVATPSSSSSSSSTRDAILGRYTRAKEDGTGTGTGSEGGFASAMETRNTRMECFETPDTNEANQTGKHIDTCGGAVRSV